MPPPFFGKPLATKKSLKNTIVGKHILLWDKSSKKYFLGDTPLHKVFRWKIKKSRQKN